MIRPNVYQKPENPKPGTKVESCSGRRWFTVNVRSIVKVKITYREGMEEVEI